MACSLMMCLQANGLVCDEEEVNKVMGARPRQGASWESALAAAQHYGMRATLTTPATVKQLKGWTDRGVPIMIAWNPEGREWSHASVVYHVTEGPIESLDETQTIFGEGPGLYVWVADPNMPNPDKTTRIIHEDLFYGKWYEKWPDYLVRRPACAIEPEITPDGRQVMASVRTASSYVPSQKMRQDWSRLVERALLRQTEGVPSGPLHFASRPGPGQGLPREAGGRSPNQAGSAAMLKRQGLTPVDFMFGEALPHRRPLVMPGEEVQDRRGKVWFFVGLDEDGKALLAKDEHELGRMQAQLTRDRLHHQVEGLSRQAENIAEQHLSSRKRKPTHEVREKKDPNAPLRAPRRKTRDEAARDLAEGRVNIRRGPHANKPQRGTGAKGKGKAQRHPKHRRDLRQQQASRIADQWLGNSSMKTSE
jgi:hypothetical protein